MLGIAGIFVLVLLVHPQPPMLSVGAQAPPISLRSSDGTLVDATAMAAHRVLVVEFIETSCTTCQQKAPELCAASQHYAHDVFVAVDAAAEPASALAAFTARYFAPPCAVTLLQDPGQSVTHAYEAGVVPTAYVIDGSGRVAYAAVAAAGIDGISSAVAAAGG
ncbi:MAG: TlpA family protein disulfide reductase [Candidatus Dormibacteria bacterium]